MAKNSKTNTVTVSLPADLVERISLLNDVDPRFVDRTIARILRDEIAIEEKLHSFAEVREENQTDDELED